MRMLLLEGPNAGSWIICTVHVLVFRFRLTPASTNKKKYRRVPDAFTCLQGSVWRISHPGDASRVGGRRQPRSEAIPSRPPSFHMLCLLSGDMRSTAGPALPARASLQRSKGGRVRARRFRRGQRKPSHRRVRLRGACPLAFRDPQCLRMTESPRHEARKLLRAESFFEQKSIFDGRYDPNPQGEYDGLDWAGLKRLSALSATNSVIGLGVSLGFPMIVRKPCGLVLPGCCIPVYFSCLTPSGTSLAGSRYLWTVCVEQVAAIANPKNIGCGVHRSHFCPTLLTTQRPSRLLLAFSHLSSSCNSRLYTSLTRNVMRLIMHMPWSARHCQHRVVGNACERI